MLPTHSGHLDLHIDHPDLLHADLSSHTVGDRTADRPGPTLEPPPTVQIEYSWWGQPHPADENGGEQQPVVVLLHEGLGSVAQWRELPARIHEQTGLPVFAFNRWGYGSSTTAANGFGVRFMHTEGLVLLPLVLTAAGIDRPILVGHSDGGSISLIAAGSGAVTPVGVMVIAPHIYVEPECASGIVSIGGQRDRIVEGLSRYHDDPAATFAAWNNVWLNPDFQDWDIRGYLPAIGCPVFAIQGADDEYATDAMITGIDTAVVDSRGAVLVPDCGHIAHRDQPEAITAHIVDFVDQVSST